MFPTREVTLSTSITYFRSSVALFWSFSICSKKLPLWKSRSLEPHSLLLSRYDPSEESPSESYSGSNTLSRSLLSGVTGVNSIYWTTELNLTRLIVVLVSSAIFRSTFFTACSSASMLTGDSRFSSFNRGEYYSIGSNGTTVSTVFTIGF